MREQTNYDKALEHVVTIRETGMGVEVGRLHSSETYALLACADAQNRIADELRALREQLLCNQPHLPQAVLDFWQFKAEHPNE